MVRDSALSSLIADIPKSTIESMKKVGRGDMIRLNTKSGQRFALRFDGPESVNKFSIELKAKHYQIVNEESKKRKKRDSLAMPNLNDPSVQELVLSLLFSPEFESFVEGLSNLIGDIEDVVKDRFP